MCEMKGRSLYQNKNNSQKIKSQKKPTFGVSSTTTRSNIIKRARKFKINHNKISEYSIYMWCECLKCNNGTTTTRTRNQL